MKHLTTEQILLAARTQHEHQHFRECSFCREHYALAQEFLNFDPASVQPEDTMVNGNTGYRLAAQTEENPAQLFRLRRTWYLDRDTSIVRVVEDLQRSILTGFLISEDKASTVRVRFEELGKEFIPDEKGMFEIGPSNTQVESMHVHLLR
jgi:hypothetical protein